jgi:hypothetical protein
MFEVGYRICQAKCKNRKYIFSLKIMDSINYNESLILFGIYVAGFNSLIL